VTGVLVNTGEPEHAELDQTLNTMFPVGLVPPVIVAVSVAETGGEVDGARVIGVWADVVMCGTLVPTLSGSQPLVAPKSCESPLYTAWKLNCPVVVVNVAESGTTLFVTLTVFGQDETCEPVQVLVV